MGLDFETHRLWVQEPTERYYTATTGVLMAHQAHLVGQYAREEALLREVLKVNPDDRDAPFLLERLERIRRGGQDPEW